MGIGSWDNHELQEINLYSIENKEPADGSLTVCHSKHCQVLAVLVKHLKLEAISKLVPIPGS